MINIPSHLDMRVRKMSTVQVCPIMGDGMRKRGGSEAVSLRERKKNPLHPFYDPAYAPNPHLLYLDLFIQ